MHWRLGVPLTLLVLTVVAVPLAKTEPRSGRFSGLASAVLVYLIYANLLAAGRGWLERGQIPEVVGLWWVHGLFLRGRRPDVVFSARPVAAVARAADGMRRRS